MSNKAQVYDAEASFVDSDSLGDPMLDSMDSLEGYVTAKVQEWEDFTEANFYSQWDEYYRLWRGLWASEDKTRETERSRIVTPALQQAVESSVAEIEEATFGHGKLFDLEDDMGDENPQDIEFLKKKLAEEFSLTEIRKNVGEVLINAAVYGTGVGEIVVEEILDMAPATQVMEGQDLEQIGVKTKTRPVVRLRPIQMKNFRIDPVATTIESAHGDALEALGPAPSAQQLQESGVYKDCYVGTAATDHDLEPDPQLDVVPYEDKVRLMKYYGLVPRHLLKKANEPELEEDEVLVSLGDEEPEDDGESFWVEAVVVIANQGVVLKAEESPFMMKDRPVVAFQWDVVPGLFWGRGVCEKGYNSQKALDAEIRGRIDALALTIHPMLAMDATRIPRGHKPQVRPGKMLLTNGNPKEVLHQFNFGSVDQITFAQAAELQKMVQQSTGAIDGTAMAATIGSNNKTGAVSMSLGPIIKRQKRTLVNFQESFWLKFVKKAAWRYMQFDPENFPVKDYKFVPVSSLGVMAREYEVSQLVQLMQTMGPDSPLYAPLVASVVDHMDIENREELLATLEKASQPTPEQQKQEEEMRQLQMREQMAKIGVFEAQAAESNARAHKYTVEAELEPKKVQADVMDAVADIRDGVTTADFRRRLDIAQTRLKERELNIKEKEIDSKREQAMQDKAASAELDNLLSS